MNIPPLIDGQWYMVRVKGDWFPAKRDSISAGGWTNDDTWEDSDREVDSFCQISVDDTIYTIVNS